MTTMTRDERNQIVLENQPLVTHFMNPYRGRGIPDEDLFGAGLIGLIEAIDTHDPSKGALSTHAAYRIRKRINELFEAQAEDALTFRRSLHELEDVYPEQARVEPVEAKTEKVVHALLSTLPAVLREAVMSEYGIDRPRTSSREEATRVGCAPTTVSRRRRAANQHLRSIAAEYAGALA